VELFEEIRLGYASGETILGLAKKHGVHRRMVRQAIESAIPPERKITRRRGHKLDPVKPFIDGILEPTSRPAQTTAHRAPHLDEAAERTPGAPGLGITGAAVRAPAQA